MREVIFKGEESIPIESASGHSVKIDVMRLAQMVDRIEFRRLTLEIETGQDLSVRTDFSIQTGPEPLLIVKSRYGPWDDSEAFIDETGEFRTIGELKAAQNAKTRH